MNQGVEATFDGEKFGRKELRDVARAGDWITGIVGEVLIQKGRIVEAGHNLLILLKS